MELLQEIGEQVRRIGAEVGPSVVGVGRRWAVGSGVLIGPGRVLTNAHNLRGEETQITLPDGSSKTGRVAGIDVDGDIALVTVEGADEKSIAWREEGPAPEIGTPVFGLSNPGGRGLRATVGFVSGTERSFRGPRGRRIGGSIEHTAPLLPGSSGGPLVDAAGRLLGVNTNRLGEGFYLAIPADRELRDRLERLERGETPARPRLGIGIAPPPVAANLRRAVGLPEVEGLLVRLVEEDSPAARAGLSEGDVIVEANGQRMASPDDLHELLDGSSPDATLELRLVRGVDERRVSVPLAA